MELRDNSERAKVLSKNGTTSAHVVLLAVKLRTDLTADSQVAPPMVARVAAGVDAVGS